MLKEKKRFLVQRFPPPMGSVFTYLPPLIRASSLEFHVGLLRYSLSFSWGAEPFLP